jgi:DNA-binding transcriptional MocR family regulator
MKFTDEELKSYLRSFFKEFDQLPTQQAIANNFGVAQNAVNERMKKLENEGYLSRNPVNKYMFSRSKKK